MKYYLGVTDTIWYNYLSVIFPEDINFWQPGGNVKFGVIDRGAPFLFKLKFPINAIGGVGFFSSHTFLPISVAWDTFGERNGCQDFLEFSRLIKRYRKERDDINPTIGCIVLTDPIFFKPEDWIETPENWGKSIVQGKSYDTLDPIGKKLWQKIEQLVQKYLSAREGRINKSPIIVEEPSGPMYGNSILQKVRLGQGAFRVLVTDAYSRKCSITGEKTLPVLEAAHIKPFATSGPHAISNGILLRSDLHKLFDNGYITVTTKLKIEVSPRIREEFENGREYYQFHGKDLFVLPDSVFERPGQSYLEWHNSNIYRG
ncbi:MAG: HNH endonuclease [Saprospiraceae bacterium]